MADSSIARIKQRYPKAYDKWTPEDDLLLEARYREGANLDQLSGLFRRQPSAITSRLFKLKFGSGSIEVKVAFAWEVVLQGDNQPYMFPNEITHYMKERYRCPAIYRWVIDCKEDDDETLIYIGEAQRLCPDRLNGYLAPGPTQQTNLRLSQQFHECVAQGRSVRLEVLNLTGAFVNDLNLTERELSHQDTRRLIERLLVTLYRHQEVKLLNL